jgi:hypothetical protein
MNKYMFDGAHETQHLGNKVRVRNRLLELHEVEKYFLEKCKEKNIKVAFDCAAFERLNWITLNYTSYNGMMQITPLCNELGVYQLYDALIDNLDAVGHIDFIRNNLKNKVGSKYIPNSNFKNKKFKIYNKKNQFKAVCILPGTNKFELLCKRKIKTIAAAWQDNLLFKIHPVTNLKILEKTGLKDIIKSCQIASVDTDMYDLIERATHVYSTYASESTLNSLILGKTVEPIDNYDKRMNNGFAPINHFCYTFSNPVDTLDKIFASPKSGMIHPDIDKDWKNKINTYLEYILEKRESQNGFYLK